MLLYRRYCVFLPLKHARIVRLAGAIVLDNSSVVSVDVLHFVICWKTCSNIVASTLTIKTELVYVPHCTYRKEIAGDKMSKNKFFSRFQVSRLY